MFRRLDLTFLLRPYLVVSASLLGATVAVQIPAFGCDGPAAKCISVNDYLGGNAMIPGTRDHLCLVLKYYRSNRFFGTTLLDSQTCGQTLSCP